MIREKLQAGFCRSGATLIAALGGYFVIALNWRLIVSAGIDVAASLQKVAFISGAFCVTAYNLRVRVVDWALKVEAPPGDTEQFAENAQLCGRRLTTLVVLFTVTAIIMGSGGFVPVQFKFAWLLSSVITGVFLASSVQFVYILFAFERLEKFMLDDAMERSRDRELSRLGLGDDHEESDGSEEHGGVTSKPDSVLDEKDFIAAITIDEEKIPKGLSFTGILGGNVATKLRESANVKIHQKPLQHGGYKSKLRSKKFHYLRKKFD